MTRHFLIRSRRLFIAAALLVALLYQAMIPAGFMPAADGSFALQVCHSGFLTQTGSHDSDRHSGGHSHVEFCPFGALPGAAPISHAIAVPLSGSIATPSLAELTVTRPFARSERAHPPRGPPFPAFS
jgi:hypothetical protein